MIPLGVVSAGCGLQSSDGSGHPYNIRLGTTVEYPTSMIFPTDLDS